MLLRSNDLPSYSFSIWQEWFLGHMMDMKLAMPCFYSPGPFIGAPSKHARRGYEQAWWFILFVQFSATVAVCGTQAVFLN